MKFNKLFIAAVAFATLAMVSCKKDEPTPTPTPTPSQEDVEDIPAVSAPDSEHMLLLVRVGKDINICNTIAMRGAMTSYGDGNPILFEKVADTETWYKAEMPVYGNAEFFHCKLMIADEEGGASYDYEGKAGEYELLNGTDAYLKLDEDLGTPDCCLSMLEEVDCSGKILYAAINGFKGNPCAAKSVYKITLKMAYAGDDAAGPAVSGNFNSWGVTLMDKVSDEEWTVEVEAQAGNEFKFQGGNGGWSNEIQKYDAELETWDKMGNLALGEDLNPVFDYSDPNLYRWSLTAGPIEDLGEIWIKCAGNGWAWAQMTQGENNTYTYETTVTDAGNVGANINIAADEQGAVWNDLGTAEANGLAEGDACVYTFVKEDGTTGTLTVAKK